LIKGQTVTLTVSDVHWLHVEASSKCNAWCPACPRNNNGFGLSPGVVEQDLSPSRFEEIISSLPSLHAVQLCGNLGDPVASAHINELVAISKKYVKKIQIHTNGSLRNTEWWKELAQALADIDHDVWFGIDGLAGVHEIYRQGTDFEKIIKNAQAFINAGGNATWQFIPYKHNEHQVLQCLKLSQDLKFKKFHVAKLYREKTLAKHYKTGQEFDLLPTDSMRSLININRAKLNVEHKNCMHLSIPSVYVSAAGEISKCCYMAIKEKFQSVDQLLSVGVDLTDKICIDNCG
jgi:sulfatase maturation enzyme AslB (radical SAM superfamily)